MYAVDEDGVHPLATGWPVGTLGDAVLVVACDDDGDCALERYPTDGGAPREVLDVGDPERAGFQAVHARDGRVALVQYDNFGGASRLLLFDSSGASLAAAQDLGTVSGMLQLLPGDLGLLVFDGQYLQHLRQVGGVWQVQNVDAQARTSIEAAFVITP